MSSSPGLMKRKRRPPSADQGGSCGVQPILRPVQPPRRPTQVNLATPVPDGSPCPGRPHPKFFLLIKLSHFHSVMNHHRLFLATSALAWITAVLPASLYGQCNGCGSDSGASAKGAGAMEGPLNQSAHADLVNPSGSAQDVTFGESTATAPPGSSQTSFTNGGGAIPPQPGEVAGYDGTAAGGTGKKPDDCPPESEASGTAPNATSTNDPQKAGEPSTDNNLDKPGSTFTPMRRSKDLLRACDRECQVSSRTRVHPSPRSISGAVHAMPVVWSQTLQQITW